MRTATAGGATARRSICKWGGVALLAVAASLGVAACGGDDEDETTGAQATGGGGAQTVAVSETEFKLDPDNPTAKPGKVTFEATNDGEVVHSLTVEGPSGSSTLDQDLQPGDSGRLTVDLSEPGKYEFFCPIDAHKDMGMVGEITVGSAAAAGGGGGGGTGGGGTGGGGGGYGY